MLDKIMKTHNSFTPIEPVEVESKILEDGTSLKVILCSYKYGIANKKYKVCVFQNNKMIDESNFLITYLKAKEIYKKMTKLYLGI